MATKHVVGFSGGIDSQACAGWVLDRYPKEDVLIVNSDAGGNEHPLTTEHVEWYSACIHPVEIVSAVVSDLGGRGKDHPARVEAGEDARLTFDLMAKIRGIFPAIRMQFCTEVLKLAPQKRLIEDLHHAGHEVIRYAGVRADESARRAKLTEREWDKYYDCELVRPLLSWSKKECFEFVKARGEEINPLYKLGFARVGCAPCVNANKEDILAWATRFPEMIDKVRAWEKSVGRTFFRPIVPRPEYVRAYREWAAEWLVSKGTKKHLNVLKPNAPPPPEPPINWIDDVVRWAKTIRGGKQLALPIAEAEAESGSCSSKYGLCE